MNNFRHFFFFVTLCLTPWFCQADVFSIWPTSTGKGGGGTNDPENALRSREIMVEPVTINEVQLSLRVALIDMRLEELLELLRKLFPGAEFAANSNSILVKIKDTSGRETRLLLVYLGTGFPIIQFSMQLPEKFPENIQWPSELPMTADGVPVKYMYFPKRDAWYGSFKTVVSSSQALSEIAGKLSTDGWSPFTGEANSGIDGKGEIFLKKNPFSIMLVNFSDNIGSVYTRRTK